MTDTAQAAAAKKAIAENKSKREKSTKETYEKVAKGKPTPTQDENDLAVMGVPVPTHEDDGTEEKHVEAGHASGGGYQTRQTTKS